jgi:hypothetical protein
MKWRGVDPETRRVRVNDSRYRYDRLCWLPECHRRAQTKQLCKGHYNKARIGKIEVPAELGVKINDPCLYEGCERPCETRGLCHTHYCQAREGRDLADLRPWRAYVLKNPCRVAGCKQPTGSRGLCLAHHHHALRCNLDADEYADIMAIEECENPGCSNVERLHIDHDHETGAVRGRLCNGCNTALGFLRDNPARARGLAKYLANNRSHATSE